MTTEVLSNLRKEMKIKVGLLFRPAQGRGSGGIPSPPGLFQRPPLQEEGCQKSLWTQLANKRPGFGPAPVDSPLHAAGARFNLFALFTSQPHLSSSLSLNSRAGPPEGSGICFACTCRVTQPASGGRLARVQPACSLNTPQSWTSCLGAL